MVEALLVATRRTLRTRHAIPHRYHERDTTPHVPAPTPGVQRRNRRRLVARASLRRVAGGQAASLATTGGKPRGDTATHPALLPLFFCRFTQSGQLHIPAGISMALKHRHDKWYTEGHVSQHSSSPGSVHRAHLVSCSPSTSYGTLWPFSMAASTSCVCDLKNGRTFARTVGAVASTRRFNSAAGGVRGEAMHTQPRRPASPRTSEPLRTSLQQADGTPDKPAGGDRCTRDRWRAANHLLWARALGCAQRTLALAHDGRHSGWRQREVVTQPDAISGGGGGASTGTRPRG